MPVLHDFQFFNIPRLTEIYEKEVKITLVSPLGLLDRIDPVGRYGKVAVTEFLLLHFFSYGLRFCFLERKQVVSQPNGNLRHDYRLQMGHPVKMLCY